MNEDLTTFIIKQLCQPIARKEIIRRVCKKSELQWKDAERLVTLIEARHNRTTTPRQTPLLLLLSIAALLVGIGLLAANLPTLLAIFQQDLPGQLLNMQGDGSRLMLTGLGITVGGMIGLWRALGNIFPPSH